MRKRLLQVMAVISLSCCLLGTANAQMQVPEEKPKKVEVSVEIEPEVEVEPLYIPVTAEPVQKTVKKKHKKKSTPYYVDIVDGYITEDSLKTICEFVGDKYDISPKLLQALAYTESHYEVNATGYSNDCGLCQIIPKYSYDRMERLGVEDIYDPYSNVLVCADILNYHKNSKYGGDINFVLMAYNMGQAGAAKRYEAGYISDYAKKVMKKAYELGY